MSRFHSASDAAAPLADPLTGLAGAARARDILGGWRGGGQSAQVHAMLIRPGDVGAVNVAFGSAAGDGVLVEAARRIVQFADDELAAADPLAARLDGGSFLLATRTACSRERWQRLGETLADTLALPFRKEDGGASIRLWPRILLARGRSGETACQLLDRLSDGVPAGEGGGAARIRWINGGGSHGSARRGLESDLLLAIDRGEIGVVFQPQFDARTDRIVGAEALGRWNHPRYGELDGSTLFTLAERADHLVHLSRHIIARSLATATSWPAPVRLSVNVTATCLAMGNFADELMATVASAGFPLDRLTIEVTEQMLIGDMELARRTLTTLGRKGVRIALDDFGAGFCNFRYLKLLPLHLIKFDRALVEGVAEDARSLAIFRGMVAMARALQLDVVVEGVESEEQRLLVAAEGCDSYQGFLRSPPISGAALLDLTRAG